MSAKPRVPRALVLDAIADQRLYSGQIARRFGYSVKWVTQLRGLYDCQGPRGGDRKSPIWQERMEAHRG